MSSPELRKAKIDLYRLLLQMPHKELSSEEVEMMYALSQDADIKSKKEAPTNVEPTPNA